MKDRSYVREEEDEEIYALKRKRKRRKDRVCTYICGRRRRDQRVREREGCSSVRGSVVAMGIGGEGYGGPGKGRSMQTHHKVLWLSRTVPIRRAPSSVGLCEADGSLSP